MNFDATEGRVFKQCAAKGRVLNTIHVPDRVWFFPVVVPGKVQNVKNWPYFCRQELSQQTTFEPQRVPFIVDLCQ